jgi:prophage tail gpP-like protein
MTAAVKLYTGETYTLPVLLAWELNYTAGVPCDAFWVRFVGNSAVTAQLHKAVTFFASQDGQRVFTGVVDEYHLEWGEDGIIVEVSGRGMAARLLDNQSPAQTYGTATTAMLLRDHVTCHGITVADAGNLSAVPGFSISSGTSEWSVLYQFAQYYSRVTPRFDRQGRLLLSKFPTEVSRTLDSTLPILSLQYREKRYGCLSSVLVQSKNQTYATSVTNSTFASQGGHAQQVVTMPSNGAFEALRYSGTYQLEKSQQERFTLEVTVAELFWGWPGELVQVKLNKAGCDGTWRISESKVCLDEGGARTELTLVAPSALI